MKLKVLLIMTMIIVLMTTKTKFSLFFKKYRKILPSSKLSSYSPTRSLYEETPPSPLWSHFSLKTWSNFLNSIQYQHPQQFLRHPSPPWRNINYLSQFCSIPKFHTLKKTRWKKKNKTKLKMKLWRKNQRPWMTLEKQSWRMQICNSEKSKYWNEE